MGICSGATTSPQIAASIHAYAICHYLLGMLSNLIEDVVPASEMTI